MSSSCLAQESAGHETKKGHPLAGQMALKGVGYRPAPCSPHPAEAGLARGPSDALRTVP